MFDTAPVLLALLFFLPALVVAVVIERRHRHAERELKAEVNRLDQALRDSREALLRVSRQHLLSPSTPVSRRASWPFPTPPAPKPRVEPGSVLQDNELENLWLSTRAEAPVHWVPSDALEPKPFKSDGDS